MPLPDVPASNILSQSPCAAVGFGCRISIPVAVPTVPECWTSTPVPVVPAPIRATTAMPGPANVRETKRVFVKSVELKKVIAPSAADTPIALPAS